MNPNLYLRIKQQKEMLQEIIGLLSLGCNIDPNVELQEIKNTVELLEELEELLG